MYNDLIISMRSMASMFDCQENENLPLVRSIVRKFKAAASAIEDLQLKLEDTTACANIARHEYQSVKSYNAELYKELKQVKEERDTAIRDLRSCDIDCNFCIHAGKVIGCDLDCEHCAEDCACGKCRNNDLWQWRGGQAKGGRC